MKAIIIGGGFAGLAAAVTLAEKGIQVSLFERRPILGGRAYSTKDSTTGDIIDNGQHLMMGCYQYTLEFLKKIKTDHLLQFQEEMRVDFADLNGKHYSLKAPNLPSPFHLLVALFRLKSLSLREKWAIGRAMNAAKKLSPHDLIALDSITAEQWLYLLKQPRETFIKFWEPLILATINEIPAFSSAKLLAVVLREALLKDKKDSLMVLSKVGLSDLYTIAAQKFIEAHGGKVFIRKAISKIVIKNSKVEKIILEDGSEEQADYYLNSTPPDAFVSMLDEETQSKPFFARFKKINFSPILAINLWFDRPILKETFVGLIDAPIHWIFNKGEILQTNPQKQEAIPVQTVPRGRRAEIPHIHSEDNRQKQSGMTEKKSNYLSLVISGAHQLKEMSHEDLLKTALQNLYKAYPESRNAVLKHHRILKELKATPSFGPGSIKLRPEIKTPISNLLLIGDWTATGLPATIEGAVKSGVTAANLIS